MKSPIRGLVTSVAFALSMGLLGTGLGEARADAPAGAMVETAIFRGAATASDAPQAVRKYFGIGVLYVPPWFKVVDGKYDLIIHFHGGAFLQEENMERTRLNAVVVSVNLGINTGPYANTYSVPGALESLIARTKQELEKTHRADGAKLGRLALTAWSAGFASIGAILSQPGEAEKIRRGPHRRRLPLAVHQRPHYLHAASREVEELRGDGHARREALRHDPLVRPDRRLPEHHRHHRGVSPRDEPREGAQHLRRPAEHEGDSTK